ncbi:hybrid sensor histidine kinase/response regulator [Nocardioides gansuensis]|uniref:Circadian input-output histidine kinase CikA n=1 Tax=Nocardioides gansuensis TaxID=2138300 RepID=A0A2T8F8G6_9ACTN|nr:response regulator [Nocardioides gansuensis]PVG81989.1 hybrid sensor histidine kinase/response regulator [Nocardioides gansuensis]
MANDRPGGSEDEDFKLRLFDAVPDGLWLIDDEGVTRWANERMAQMLGRRLEEMVGLRVVETLDQQGRHDFERALARMRATGEGGTNIDSYLVRPDGTTVWGLVSFAPVHHEGRRIGWLHRVTPYTERKKLLEQLENAQRIAHVGSWEWDVGSNVIRWSDELYRIFGVSQGAPASYESYLELIHPDDRELASSAVARAVETGEAYSFDHRVVRADDTLRWVRGRGVAEYGADGAVVRLSGTAQDITEMRRADEQAREATRRLYVQQQMLAAANSAATLREALEMAADGLPELTNWTAVCAHLFSGPAGSRDVVVFDVDQGVAPDHLLAEAARASGEIEVGTPSTIDEAQSLVAMPVVLDGEVICVVELLTDKQPPDENSQQIMEQMAAHLALVAGRERSAIELREARDAALEASRLKSEFLATMSHEIRTPLNGVIGLTELLLSTGLDEQQRRLVENLQGAGLTLLDLINDILDLSKIESGKLELETAEFDVRAVFDRAASVLSRHAHEKGLELVVACDPDVPLRLRGDPVRLGQVVINLGSNAVKFTDKGEVVIDARIERETPTDVALRVDVIDTGVGIEPDESERLFDAFIQGDASTTRRHGGTGLGLAICKRLVAALGGEIWVTSEPGAGSTFSFTATLERADPATARTSPVPKLRGRRVLVIDDNDTSRLRLERQLSAWHMTTMSAGSADAAIKILADAVGSGEPFDIALVDHQMPGRDGLALARHMRDDPALRETSILLLSPDPALALPEAGDLRPEHTLAKPVRHADLHNRLHALLGSPFDLVEPGRDEAPGLGVRVLLVEDIPVNQLVAIGLLEQMGCAVDVVGDGIEAVERLTRPHDYGAVLMDCRMPRMDGFDATRIVRQHEPAGQRVPIIAMTASALEGERERCLAAGMDDFLTKPVNADELARAIGEWTRTRPSTGQAATDPPAQPDWSAAPARADAPDPGVLDPDRIEMLDELVKDGISFFERTAASFMANAADHLAAIRAALDQGDATSLVASAHRLKGSALNLGLPRVADSAAELEALGDAGQIQGSGQILARLTHEVEAAVAALRDRTNGSR